MINQELAITEDINILPRYTGEDVPIIERSPSEAGRTGWWEGDTGEVRLTVLRNAFTYGASDEEACYLAGIAKSSLYQYIKKINPNFGEEKESLKMHPVFRARQIVLRNMTQNAEMAWKYLQKKLPKEFGDEPSKWVTEINSINSVFSKDFFEIEDETDSTTNILSDQPAV